MVSKKTTLWSRGQKGHQLSSSTGVVATETGRTSLRNPAQIGKRFCFGRELPLLGD